MELKRLLEAHHQKRNISGRFSSSDDVTADEVTEQPKKRRTSPGRSKKTGESYVNKSYVQDEEEATGKDKNKDARKVKI